MIYQVFGEIANPLCQINSGASCYGNIDTAGAGLTGFISNIIQLIAIAAGIFALFNLVTAGFEYITSRGDPKGIESARQKIYMSVIGLAIISISFTVAAILGQLLFGSWSAIIAPEIIGPGSSTGGT